MNKFDAEQVRKSAYKVKSCVLGKIAADIESRLPKRPEPLDDWEKYKLILSGVATIKKDIRRKDFFDRYESDKPKLISSFNYPVPEEQAAYDSAKKAIKQESKDRELAAELAFNRVADERIMGLLTPKEFLDQLEKMAQQDW